MDEWDSDDEGQELDYDPLIAAVRDGAEEEVAQLLAAGWADDDDAVWLAGVEACLSCRMDIVKMLLRERADLATGFGTGYILLHCAAQSDRSADARLVKAVLEANPASAEAVSEHGTVPLHFAASSLNPAVVQLLLAAAPGTVDQLDHRGWPPLGCALLAGCHGKLPAAAECWRLLVDAAPAAQPTLSTLVKHRSHPTVTALLADLAARLPLTEADWRSIPAPCPELACALPAVLPRSTAEAGWLVGRLAAEQRGWLRTAVLCLGRAALPGELALGILALCLRDG